MGQENNQEKMLIDLRLLWLRGNPILHKFFLTWDEVEKSVYSQMQDSETGKTQSELEPQKETGTGGSIESTTQPKEVVFPFDKYEIKIRLSPNNEFLGISEIRVRKDFMTYKEKTTAEGFHDVEAFYPE